MYSLFFICLTFFVVTLNISCSVVHFELKDSNSNTYKETSHPPNTFYFGPIPLPKQIQNGPQAFIFPSNIEITTNVNYCNILDDAINRFYKAIFKSSIKTSTRVINAQIIKKMNITILVACMDTGKSNAKQWPSETMVEDYELVVTSNEIQIRSNEVWGALRALETLTQLVYTDITGQVLINETNIADSPRFLHRGLLLDTSRHFIPMEILYQNLEAMSIAKLNVFHWHIVDNPSFPYTSMAYPQMSRQGAYHPYTHVYSQQDIADVIEFARRRGIRVIPEFDTPGHTLSWGKAIQPQILTPCYTQSKPNGAFGPMDPSQNSTFSFLSKLMGEVTEVFPDNYLHLGGDEVPFGCWQSNPNIQKFMAKMKFGTDYAKLEEYYMNRLIQTTLANKPPYKSVKLLVWQEVIDNNVTVPKDTIVHVWKGEAAWSQEMASVTKLGYPALLSSCWYLNYIKYGVDWAPYYQCDPQNFNGTDSQKKLVMGGEACMWGEYVDGSNLMTRTWPRVAVVAERLWSPASVNNVQQMSQRLENFRCRLLKRGINAEPPNSANFCQI